LLLRDRPATRFAPQRTAGDPASASGWNASDPLNG